MSLADVIILIVVVLILSAIIYFSFIRPKLKGETTCSKCAYAKECKNKKCCDANNEVQKETKTQEKTKDETQKG